MPTKIAFIINPISGTGRKSELPELIKNGLNVNQFDPETVYTEHKGHATLLAKQFIDRGFRYIVAVGGDGTVNEVARAIIHTDCVLGIIPIGSGNGLARHLGIPMNLGKAVSDLNHSEVIKIDYGIVNGKPFFCTCGTGFDAYVSTEFAKGKKRGVMSYLEKVITGYFSYKSQNYHLKGKNIDMKTKAFVMTFANASQWGNNAYIAPQASVQDGNLDISILSSFPIIAIPTLALQLFNKNIDKDFFMTTLRSERLTLLREESGPFHYDGEPYDEGKKIQIHIVPDGLNVLVKKRF